MYNFSNIHFDDFEYDGKKLSEFGGFVGSEKGLKQYPLIPNRNYVTDKPIGSNVTTVFDSSLEPRPFEVPIVFEELTDGKIREIAMWLDSPTPKKFMYVGDSVYINACLDGDFEFQSSSGVDGQVELKFIAYNPFYFSNTECNQTISSLVSGTEYKYTNNGYYDLEPYITIGCTGDIKLEILDSNKNVYTTTNVTDITGGVIIDSLNEDCTLLSGASHFSKIDNFPLLSRGDFYIKVTGTSLANLNIKYRERYL